MHDWFGFESHQPGTGRIGSHRVIRKHDLSQRTRSSVEWAVTFHSNDSVRNHEMKRDGCAQIKDEIRSELAT